MSNNKANKIFLAAALTLPLAFGSLLMAQAPVVVQRADLSIPFGTVSGKLVVVADQLVFIDNDRQEDSFAIARSEIREMKTEGDVVMITTRRPLRARGEEKSQFNFRLREGSSESLTLWASVKSTAPATTTATVATPATPAASKDEEGERWVYNARHPHKVALVPSGNCTGKLIITRDRVVYESLEVREHTQQWPLVDIKKIKRKNPYQIEIEPFNREKYTLEIEGQGIDIGVHKKLMNWISLARQK